VIEDLFLESLQNGIELHRMRCEWIMIYAAKEGFMAKSNLEGKHIEIKSLG